MTAPSVTAHQASPGAADAARAERRAEELRRTLLHHAKAYYVLGVEPADEDRDGKSHFIRVKTTAKHADVRSRVQVFIPQKK